MDFLKKIIKETGNEYASIVAEGVTAGDIESFIDTGSYSFNALLSGSIYGGLPSNKITALAGESATGKTFFVLGMVKHFLDANPEGGVLYFESESALTKSMVENRSIDSTRMVIVPVTTVQEFRTQAIKIVDSYLKQPIEEKQPLFLALDSLGMLSTTKEVEDTTEGKETRDMTRAQIIKAAFRVLTLKLGRAKIPMVITNHTYDVVGSYIPMKEMSGGSGIKYAASTIIYLSKKKDKEGIEVVGNIVKCKIHKSRITKENTSIDVRISYDKGLDKYYGLIDLAVKHGIFKQVSTRIELPDGTKQYGKTILGDPEKYFTKDVLNQIDKAAKKEFTYGG
ncbi:MAG: recombinase RecA [Candidatus Neomarinimicrobiota bacterium]|nr:MAG: recombinase RecA [Candidatus Neomarinimicrobiota bacterium]